MTPAPVLELPQPAASGLVNGLFRVVVLDAEDPLVTGKCGTCGGTGWGENEWRPARMRRCTDCSDGRVERLEPGSRVLVASNGEEPGAGDIGEWHYGPAEVMGCTIRDSRHTHNDECTGWHSVFAMADNRGEGFYLELPADSIVGSAVVEAVAPVEVDDGIKVPTPPPVVLLYGSAAIYFSDKPGEGRDLTDDLPWLPAPADLVGKVALVVKDAKPCPPVPLSEWSQE